MGEEYLRKWCALNLGGKSSVVKGLIMLTCASLHNEFSVHMQ